MPHTWKCMRLFLLFTNQILEFLAIWLSKCISIDWNYLDWSVFIFIVGLLWYDLINKGAVAYLQLSWLEIMDYIWIHAKYWYWMGQNSLRYRVLSCLYLYKCIEHIKSESVRVIEGYFELITWNGLKIQKRLIQKE